jgi:hypothetical protein
VWNLCIQLSATVSVQLFSLLYVTVHLSLLYNTTSESVTCRLSERHVHARVAMIVDRECWSGPAVTIHPFTTASHSSGHSIPLCSSGSIPLLPQWDTASRSSGACSSGHAVHSFTRPPDHCGDSNPKAEFPARPKSWGFGPAVSQGMGRCSHSISGWKLLETAGNC